MSPACWFALSALFFGCIVWEFIRTMHRKAQENKKTWND